MSLHKKAIAMLALSALPSGTKNLQQSATARLQLPAAVALRVQVAINLSPEGLGFRASNFAVRRNNNMFGASPRSNNTSIE